MAPDERTEDALGTPGSRTRGAWHAAFALLAVMIATSVYGSFAIAEGARVAVHWNAHGRADGYAGKVFALAALPLLAAVVLSAFLLATRFSPKLATNARALAAICVASTGVQAAMHLVTVLAGAGRHVNMNLAVALTQAFLMLVVGNYLPMIRPNRFLGIRTPWTMRSEVSWRRTHALGGRLFLALGALVLTVALFAPALANSVLLAGIVTLLVTVCVYSYWAAHRTV